MKRNKHILINLTQDQYNALRFLASKDNRKISDIAYLLIIDAINKKLVIECDVYNSGFKPLKYNNDDE